MKTMAIACQMYVVETLIVCVFFFFYVIEGGHTGLHRRYLQSYFFSSSSMTFDALSAYGRHLVSEPLGKELSSEEASSLSPFKNFIVHNSAL